jgi:NAD(P)-dependent dehydrogenase (short-subunit alcohol dehydrogenase family)
MGLRGLTDRVVVVVGGATGIGAATAARLGEEGARVVVGDLAGEAAQRTAERIVAAGGVASAAAFDLADPDSVAGLIDTAANVYGGIDAIFNVGADMAAIRADTDVVDIDLEIWNRVMAVNLRGTSWP